MSGFVAGIVAAGLSSLFPNYLLGPWIISDYLGRPRDLNRKDYRIIVVVTALAGLVVPIFGGSPVHIMIASQALSPLIMPLIAFFTLVLLLRRDFAEPNRNNIAFNVALGVTVLFTLYMSYVAMEGFLEIILSSGDS